MNRSTNIRRGVATGIAGAGLTLVGIGIASAAEDEAQSVSSTLASSSATDTGSAEHSERDRGHGEGRGHGPGGPELAEALGVSETELESALESVREQSQTDRSTPPANGELKERRDQMINALAEELGLSTAEVASAFEERQQGRADERRTVLSDRLDEAVSEGDLTAEDQASVLKAFDAGVLGGTSGGERGAR